MNRPVNDSFDYDLDSFVAGDHGQLLADVAASLEGVRNPADVLRDVEPDYHRSLYDGIDAAGFYDLLRKVPIKPKQKLGRAIKAPLRTWSMASASSMLRQLRRAKTYDMRFGLELINFALREASPVTSPCWPEAINTEAARRAAERGVQLTTVPEAIELYGVSAVRVGLIMAAVGSVEEAMNVSRIVVEDDLCPPAWRDHDELVTSARAFIELAAAFDAHRHEHRDAHATPDDSIAGVADGEDDAIGDEGDDESGGRGDDTGSTQDGPVPTNADNRPENPAPEPVPAPVVDRAGPQASRHSTRDTTPTRAEARAQIVDALTEMRSLDTQIRALAASLDATTDPHVLAVNLESLRSPGPEGETIDVLTSALREGTSTVEHHGFVTAVIALAAAAAAGADRTALRELDAAARQFPIAAELHDVLFDARGRTEPLPLTVDPDPLAAMIAAAGPGPLPYNDPSLDRLDQPDTTNATPAAPTAPASNVPIVEDRSAVSDASTAAIITGPNAGTTDGHDDPSDVVTAETPAHETGTQATTSPGEPVAQPGPTAEPPAADDMPDHDRVGPEDSAGQHGSDEEQADDLVVAGVSFVDPVAVQATQRAAVPNEQGTQREYRTLLASAIGAGRMSLAAHLAAGEHDEGRQVTIEVACLAGAMRSPASPLAGAFGTRLGALYETNVDQALRPMLAATMARATLVAPGTGAGAVCAMLAGQGYVEIGPAAAAVLTTISDAANRGVVFSPSTAGHESSRAEEFAALIVAARAEMQRPGRSMFARASYMLERWRQQGQPLWELLDPVINDRRADAGSVAQLASTLRGQGASELIQETDDNMRTNKQPRITGPASTILVKRIHTAAAIASQWASLAGPAADSRSSDATIRSNLTGLRAALTSELRDLGASPDCLVSAAAVAAGRLYDDIYNIAAGMISTAPETSPDHVLNADLLRFGLGAQVADPAELDKFTVAEFPPLDEVLARYSTAHDLASVEALAAVCASGIDGCDLTVELAAARTKSLGVLADRRATTEAELAAHRRRGQLSPELSDTADARIATAANPDRLDIGAALTELDAIVADFRTSARQIATQLAAELDSITTTSTIDPAGLDRVRAQLEAGELGTADDLLTRLHAGEPLGELEHATVDISTFWPAVPEALSAGIDDEVRAAAASGGVAHGTLDFATTTGNSRAVTSAFAGWVQARDGDREATWILLLRDALKILGLEVATERRTTASGGTDRVWVDFEGVRRTGKAMVPEFGDSSGDRVRCLLVWGHPSADKIVAWSDADNENRPVIVLHFGTMSAKVRSALHDRLRGTNRRPMIVVDDAVLAWVAAQGTGTLETTTRATLPFSAVNPFVTNTAVVPVEMFYGRVQERRDVMYDPDTTFIYGGRRLGKSALLRAAQREFNTPTQRSIYIDLYNSSIGATRRPEVVWELLERELDEAGIITVTKTSRRRSVASEEVVVAGIRTWLDGDQQRRLLVLLDETDAFFDEDALKGFPSTGRFRSLKDTHEGRFKVVFAGLHQVQRFAGHANQPFPQLGRPTPIGPLATQAAFDLISRPLGALGYRFTDADLVSRLIGRCNSIPILLQACGRQLLTHLRQKDDFGVGLPRTITSADVDAVLADPALDTEIISRFDMTLELDQRYKVIAYTIALHGTPMTTEELFADCISTWAAGFKNNNLTSFRALVQELVDLGVLTARPGGRDRGWEIRGINVRSLLGSDERILARLVEISNTTQPPHEFAAGADRMKLSSGRSPLSASQISDILNPGHNQWCVVVGTPASGVGRASASLQEGVTRFANRVEFMSVSSARVLGSALRKTDGVAAHRVIVDDMAAKDVSGANVERTVRLVLDDQPSAGRTRSVVLIVTPAQYVEILELLDAEPGGAVGPDVVLACERYDAQAFDVLHYSLEKGFREPEREAVLALTGGWPELVEHACDLCMTTANTTSVISKLQAEMTGDGADLHMLAQTAVATGTIGVAFHTLAQLSSTAADSADLQTLVGLLAEVCPPRTAGHIVDALRLADLLATSDGESWHCEPVLAGASRRVGHDAAAPDD